MASGADELESTTRYICTCSKYNFGRPHPVSKATFYRHINKADTDKEKERLRATKTREGFDLGKQSAQTVSRCAAILQAMAKRCNEMVEDAQQHVGRQKRARGPDIDTCTHESDQPETGPSPPDDEVDKEMPPITPDAPDGPAHDESTNKAMPPPIPDLSNANCDPADDGNLLPGTPNAPDDVFHPPDDEELSMSSLLDPEVSLPGHPAPTVEADYGGPLRTTDIHYQHRPRPVIDLEALSATATLPSMQQTMHFIKTLKHASLDDPASKLSKDMLKRLWNPQSHPISIENVGTHYSIATYLALENASQNAYNHVCQAARSAFAASPGVGDILSFLTPSRTEMRTAVHNPRRETAEGHGASRCGLNKAVPY
ncbi:hypothetical protein EDD15DRAFT_2369536 [Pisolithus albus]|nr:hypothetical protein EDD15DRAFT_2369536 [Pisolithus albus]